MDIIIYSPNAGANELKAQAVIAKLLEVPSFIHCMSAVSTVSPTLENLESLPFFSVVLADTLPTHIHLIGAVASVQEYRKKHNKPDLLAVYCTTRNPIE